MADHARPGLDRSRVKHIIVLMMENRSFDHLLGYLKHEDPKFPNLEDIKPSCPVNPARPNGRRVATTANASSVLGNDPDHSHQAVMLQLFGREGTPGVGTPSMTGFIASYRHKLAHGTLRPLTLWERIVNALLAGLKLLWSRLQRRPGPILAKPNAIMKCFPESDIPLLGFLAKQFAVLVNWHASVPGETWPNRQFAHAGTSHGTARTDLQAVQPPELDTARPEAATERELNEFQASLVELAGAVRIARQRADGAEAMVVLEFIPDPACHEVVETGVLRPGSDADRAVEDVVADFTRQGHRPDPTHVEFG